MRLSSTGVIDSTDGAYALLGAGFDVDDLVDVPGGVEEPAAAAGASHVLVTTFGEWEPLEVSVILLPRRPMPLHAESWGVIVETTFNNRKQGPLVVADNELVPSAPVIGVELPSGEFGMRIATRSVEMVQSFYDRGFWTKGSDTEPMESHLIEVWPL